MASLVKPIPRQYDILAEAETADGRVVKRVEARADGLADIAEAFRLAAQEARTAHLPVARVKLTARRGGVTEVAMVDESAELAALAQSALLDGKTKLDDPPPPESPPAAAPRGPDPASPPTITSAPCPVCGHPVLGRHQSWCSVGNGPPSLGSRPGLVHGLLTALGQLGPQYFPWHAEFEPGMLYYQITGRWRGAEFNYRVAEQALLQIRDVKSLASLIVHYAHDLVAKWGGKP